jgi:hypothetical protein
MPGNYRIGIICLLLIFRFNSEDNAGFPGLLIVEPNPLSSPVVSNIGNIFIIGADLYLLNDLIFL